MVIGLRLSFVCLQIQSLLIIVCMCCFSILNWFVLERYNPDCSDGNSKELNIKSEFSTVTIMY